MTKESKFVYRRRTPEQFKAVMNRRGSGGFDSYIKRDYKRYKIQDGKNLIRFLPPTWDDADHFAMEIYVNFDVGPDKGRYLSLSRMGKGRDPLAEARQLAQRTGDQELAKLLNPSRRWIAWVIDRLHPEEGPQLLEYPPKLNTAIMTASTDEDTNEIVYVDDPAEGADVRFYREGTGKTGTDYPGEKVKVLKVSPLSEDPAEAQEWLSYVKANPITECLQYYDYDHISAVFNGAAKPVADDDEANDEVPQKAPAKATAKPWEDEDEAENEPAPPRGIALPSDDEDEDDEPAPRAAKADDDDEALSIRDRLRRRRERL